MRALRFVFLGLAAFVLVAVGWRFTADRPAPSRPGPLAMPVSAPAAPLPGTNREVARPRVADPSEFAPFYTALRSDFPRTYAQVVDAEQRTESATGAPPDADAAIWDALRALQQSQGLLAARAGTDDLRAYFDARLSVLDALAAEDPRTCADFLYGIMDPPFAGFTARHRGLVAILASRQLAAILGGRDKKTDRTPPEAADFDSFAAALASHALSPDEIAVLLDGKALDPPLPDARLCDMGRIYLSVLRQLPDAVRYRIYGLAAELLARS